MKPGLRPLEGSTELFSPTSVKFFDKQRKSFAQTLAKAEGQVTSIQARPERSKTKKSKEALPSEIGEVLSPRLLKRVMTAVVIGNTPPEFRLTFCTDQENWSISQVISAYRFKHYVESDFKQMKDTKVVSFSPMFHWSKQRIRIHALYCTLALTVSWLILDKRLWLGSISALGSFFVSSLGSKRQYCSKRRARTTAGNEDAHRDG